jgi:hypothetical protein
VENLVENSGVRRIFLGKPGGAAVCTKMVRLVDRADQHIIASRIFSSGGGRLAPRTTCKLV